MKGIRLCNNDITREETIRCIALIQSQINRDRSRVAKRIDRLTWWFRRRKLQPVGKTTDSNGTIGLEVFNAGHSIRDIRL